jgi:hypothetical protein
MFYLYCLSDEVTPGMLEGVTGIAGTIPRLMDVGGIAAVASEIGETRIAVTSENVLAHDGVVRHLLPHVTPLPFRFGATAGIDRITSYLDTHRKSLEQTLERVRGSVEMSLRVIGNLERDTGEAIGGKSDHEIDSQASGTGTRFLRTKQREIQGDERLNRRAEQSQAWLDSILNDVVRETSVRLTPAEPLFLSASHLVERRKLDTYREKIACARGARPELHFLTSGPWAPYTFAVLFS